MQRACNARGLTCTLADLATYRAGSASAKLLCWRSCLLLLRSGECGHLRKPSLDRCRRPGGSSSIRGSIQLVPGFRKPPDVTLLLADDASYAFIVALNPSRRATTGGGLQRPARASSRSSLELHVAGARHAGFSHRYPHRRGIERTGAAAGNATAVCGPRTERRWPIAPFASSLRPLRGARVAELERRIRQRRNEHRTSCVTPSIRRRCRSSRDYIAAYTHPLPAGTFNRGYACTNAARFLLQRITCSYDAPDLPEGGARFTRTLTLGDDSNRVDRR